MTKKTSYLAHLYRSISKRAHANTIFADFDNEALSYRQLLTESRRTASMFRDFKIRKGARVIILTNHDLHAISLFISALLNGITPIILAADTKSHRLKTIVKKVKPALLFIDSGRLKTWQWLERYCCIPVSEQAPRKPKRPHWFLGVKGRKELPYPEIIGRYQERKPSCSAEPDDIAFIIFTSGTTSTPKGIIITQENLFEHIKTIIRIFNYDENKIVFNNMALAHADGLVQGPLLALYSGAQLFRPESFAIQNLEKLLSKINTKKITHFITVPTVLSLIDRFLKRDDYFTGAVFCHLVSVAAKINPELWQRFQSRFNTRICNIYGLTETVSGGLFCGPADHTFSIGTVGKPIDMEARVVDTNGLDCAPGEEGELWLKGVNVIPGYLDDHVATESLFSEDWLRTGDLAIKDSGGFYNIVGRIKSVIVSGGYNIHPDEVNEVLMLHPDVNDAATISVSDRDWGELVASAVESDVLVDENMLINHCRTYLESIKIPKRIVQLNKLPRGISGKVKLQELRNVLEVGVQDISHHQAPDISEILDLAATVFNTTPQSLDEKLPPGEIPGWDSLGHLNLIAAVEKKYGVEFEIESMMQVNSLGDLLHVLTAISQKPTAPQNRQSLQLSPLSKLEYETMQRAVASSSVGEKTAGSLVISKNLAGSKKPLYWCFNALEYEFGRLAEGLGPDQPIFALYSGGGVLNRSISPDHLAEHYVNELLEHSSDGDFVIGGNCRGAKVAWKMTKLLEDKGVQPEKVCLMEYFSEEMYQGVQGELLLIYGKQSPFSYPQEFNWQEEGWEDSFQRLPQVHTTPGTHGDFFTDANEAPLLNKIRQFLYIDPE